MPTVLRVGRYRFFFFSNEGSEPPHIHVKAGEDEAKFWLDPIALSANYGFAPHDLKSIRRIIFQYRPKLLEAWREHCGAIE